MFITLDDGLKNSKLSLPLCTFTLGHNFGFTFFYYKLFFFGRRNIYYHNLSILEKIKIFSKTYFQIINRDANFF